MADLNQVITSETQLINDRVAKIDAEATTQKRINQFNDSARKRYDIWTSIIFNIVIGLIVYLVLIFASQTFTFIPSSLFDLATAITFVVVIYISYKQYLIIQSRDKLNFDELDLAPMPAQPSPADNIVKTNELAKSGDLTGITAANECTGSSCCGTDTIWSVDSKTCVTVPPVSEFTTLEQAFQVGEYQNNFMQRQIDVSSLGKTNILPSLDEYEKTFTRV